MTRPHVNNVCKAASFAIWRIGRIRHLLDQQSAERLVHAFITSRLDYCNSLLFGLPDTYINRLQLIQNSAARLVARVRKYDHITPVLKMLHWLPVKQRCIFKFLLLAYKCFNGLAPKYLCDLLVAHQPARTLRSSSMGLIVPPRFKTQFYGARAFSVAAPWLCPHRPGVLVRWTASRSR